MPDFIIDVTDVRRNGVKVAEQPISAVNRDEALTVGFAEALSQDKFPPEALLLYRTALSKGFSRDEAAEEILNRYGFQFFVRESAAAPTPPPAAPTARATQGLDAPVAPGTVIAVRPQFTPAGFSPRKLVQEKLRDLRRQKAQLDIQYKDFSKQRDRVVREIYECETLLAKKPAPKPAPVGKIRRADNNG